MSEAKRRISIVLFDVEYDNGPTKLDEDEAMLQIFAFTEAQQFREISGVRYQAGNYDNRDGHGRMWTGRIDLQKTSSRLNTTKDPRKGYTLEDDAKPVITSESSTYYAYDPRSHILAFRERAWLPHTRLVTYVRKASALPGRGFRLVLKPRVEHRELRQWLQYLDSVHAISFEYRHSQSPGSAAIDKIFDETDADRAHERLVAPKGGKLNVDALTKGKSYPADLVDHIAKNENNGEVTIEGMLEGEILKIRPAEGVQRRVAESGTEPKSLMDTLVSILKGLGTGR